MREMPVLTRIEGRAGRITLNRPSALHALNLEMCQLITAALLDWQDDDRVELVLVDHADGTRGFCAGGDIRMLATSGADDSVEAKAFFAAEYRLNALIHGYSRPYVALMDGVTMGGGVGISVHGSHRIATQNTMFAMPEAGIGLFPDVGGGWFLPRLEGELGVWLALTGARLKGLDVLAAGVATHFSGEDTGALKARICETGLAALEGLQTQAEGDFAAHRGVIDRCFAGDSVEAIIGALGQDEDAFAAAQRDILLTRSPTTMKVALRQIRAGAAMTAFADNMRMEYRIGARMVSRHDFQEGVRAVIIDKDNDPKWDPPTPERISDREVDAIFAPLPEGDLKMIWED